MTLIIEIALGIVLGFILLRYLDVIIGSAVLLVVGAIAIGLLIFLGTYFFEHISDLISFVVATFFLVLILLGTAVVAFLIGLISYKLPMIRTLAKNDKVVTFGQFINDYKLNKQIFEHSDFIAEKIRIGYLTLLLLGLIYGVSYAIGNFFFDVQFGGFIGIALIYSMLFFLKPYAPKTYQMTDDELKKQIEIRKGLGYDTKELEDRLTSK